ncbi:hypothetical protein [Caldimonas brevitalea]|uniref:Uncharacterized protein n=1 Tax=Caldimonas brevitalea TaxID=413882 RepID=A0A0G3BU83_9BURK|nr:hypothetical protein [Caldimonas brevitalea]AKJ30921.1 hypothetical protein AAW51_4230 [Caldimonas brevitalea]
MSLDLHLSRQLDNPRVAAVYALLTLMLLVAGVYRVFVRGAFRTFSSAWRRYRRR